MNQLKFRVWHKRRKKYYEVLHLHLDSFGGNWVTAKGFDVIENKDIHIQIQAKDCIIEQFTGLKDIKGVEIYEGDIVRYEVDTGCANGSVFSGNEIVSFGRPWGLGNADIGWVFGDPVDSPSDECEVIGNIHDNQELMEK